MHERDRSVLAVLFVCEDRHRQSMEDDKPTNRRPKIGAERREDAGPDIDRRVTAKLIHEEIVGVEAGDEGGKLSPANTTT